MRAFIALPIPDVVGAYIKATQDRLNPMVDGIRWVPLANVHLTLKFLGSIDPAMVPVIASRLDRMACLTQAFFLRIQDVGAFPNKRRARVLWVGLQGDLPRLKSLQKSIEDALEPLGFEREKRPFRAHLTIGRTRGKGPGCMLRELPTSKQAWPEPFNVNEVHLYRSLLKPMGAQYRLLHAVPLAAAGEAIAE